MTADVRSIDALRDWLAQVAKYRATSAEALSGVQMEIRRGCDWVAEQGQLWSRAVRTCEEQVVQAKAELSGRKFADYSGRDPDTTIQERNLRRAQAKLEHAHEMVAKCKSWAGRLPKLIDETYNGRARRLGLTLDGELAQAVAQLDRRIAALEAYAGLRPDFAPAPSASSLPSTTGESES